MSNLICPKCGRTNDKIEFIEAFCIDCYPVKIEAPTKITFERCGRCERMKFRGDWIPYNERKLNEFIISKCKGDFESAEYDFVTQNAVFTITGGSRIKKEILFELTKTICQQCSRISGGYYEGIIQLRGNRTKQEKYAKMLIEKLEKITFITKTEEKEEGLDLYVGRSKPIVRLISDLGIKTLITKKLVGRDQGKRLYRTTFLIRFD
ncbi:NMD3 family protein [Candidatus Bilamarchaeum dharawalense]|uniref:NMD3 family protein n=1 Tax=Candidatus Bilamarchaeum dharawalense TaxID=2885759 RepID=A0A5E4LS07_9ARCH|nr:NMD3 family protein [Candidatus Bilamarchaeum dharawalense]